MKTNKTTFRHDYFLRTNPPNKKRIRLKKGSHYTLFLTFTLRFIVVIYSSVTYNILKSGKCPDV